MTKADFFYIIEKLFNYTSRNVCYHITREYLIGGARNMKMTFQPKKRQRAKVHGFRARMKTAGGRKVIAARRAKGRAKLTA